LTAKNKGKNYEGSGWKRLKTEEKRENVGREEILDGVRKIPGHSKKL